MKYKKKINKKMLCIVTHTRKLINDSPLFYVYYYHALPHIYTQKLKKNFEIIKNYELMIYNVEIVIIKIKYQKNMCLL